MVQKVSVFMGGTGANNAADARLNLQVASAEQTNIVANTVDVYA